MTRFNRGVDWVEAETGMMVEMLAAGRTHGEIAAALNERFHKGAEIRRPVQIAGKVQHLRQRGKLPEFDGENRNHAGVAWSPDEITAMTVARRDGTTLAGIALLLNDRFHEGRDARNAAQVMYQAQRQGVTVTSAQSRYIRVKAQKRARPADYKPGARRPWTEAELAVLREHAGPCISATKLAAEINRRCHGGVEIRNRDHVRAQVSNLRRAGTLEAEAVKHTVSAVALDVGARTTRPHGASLQQGPDTPSTLRRDAGNVAKPVGIPTAGTRFPTTATAEARSNPVRPGHAVVPSETAAADPDRSAAFFGSRRVVPMPGAAIGRSRTCCWLEGHAPFFADGEDPYCGKPSVPGSSWCATHHARVFRPTPPIHSREAADVA